jgi:hypothetical protein
MTMKRSPVTRINRGLKVLLLGMTLPLFLQTTVLGQNQNNCSEAEIKANIEKFVGYQSAKVRDAAFNNVVICNSASVNALREVLKDKKKPESIRDAAAFALAKIGKNAVDAIPELREALKDDSPYVRSNAAYALAEMGKKAKVTIPDLIKTLDDPSINVRGNAVYALGEMGKEGSKAIKPLLNHLFQGHSDIRDKAAISLWLIIWDSSALNLPIIIFGHGLFWITLIVFYPKFSFIQSFFFWNSKVRKYLGLWYIDSALTHIPFLTNRLLSPFKENLIEEAHLDGFDAKAYFPDSHVILKPEVELRSQVKPTESKPLNEVIPELKGKFLLEGESGLGKSMFLVSLAKKAYQSKRIVVYLLARDCSQGVIKAIQNKVLGTLQEDSNSNFFSSLIYNGSIDIVIDGLNEVSPDTRVIINNFVKRFKNSKCNIVMATQPLLGESPITTYILQPLLDNQIKDFLCSRAAILPRDALLKGKEYEQACQDYLAQILVQQLSKDEKKAIHQRLSNPMDLETVAYMLAEKKTPNLLNLQQDQYERMAQEYKRINNQKSFPLQTFSEAIYQALITEGETFTIPADNWQDELEVMEDYRYKMVYRRQKKQDGKLKTEWDFRHDKIRDFFIVQTFLQPENENRYLDHIDDPRFRGVYFLLATMMPLEAAKNLREQLIQYAADTKDHTVSDTFIQLFRSREAIASVKDKDK